MMTLSRISVPASFILLIGALFGCQPPQELGDRIPTEPWVDLPVIKDYLEREVAFTSFEGEPFCAYDVIDAQKVDIENFVYLWVLCQEYYPSDQGLQKGGAMMIPMALTLEQKSEEFEVLAHQLPRDGSYYTEDLNKIFPASVRQRMRNETVEIRNQRVKRLAKKTLKASQE